jgi:hypothetical protein
MLRNAVDPHQLSHIRKALDALFDKYGREVQKSKTPDVNDEDWEQIKRSHIFDRTFKSLTGTSYFEIIRQSRLWELAALAFGEAEIAESPVSNCRRVMDADLHQFWDKPIEFHVDAQVFYDDKLSINFWTPLNPCGVEAPGLKIIMLGVKQTLEYLEYNPEGYEPTPRDIALMYKFRCQKMDLDQIEKNGLASHIYIPKFELGDVLAFTNFTMHATHYTRAMVKSRLSVEVRVDVPGYSLH